MKLRPAARRVALAAVLVLVVLVLVLALQAGSTPRPGPFYVPPAHLPGGPRGTIIRDELIPELYPGAKAYRVLYKSTGPDGRPIAASGLVVVPEGPAPRRGRAIVAFTHRTVGIARSCAPSLRSSGAGQVIEGLGQFIAAGYVVAAADYSGLGAPGPSSYLSGPVEAMNTLDVVRAAHRLRAADARVDFAVWGDSLGGQAALFTASLAASYAPGLHLTGVAAGAPLPDPAEMLRVNGAKHADSVGKVLVAMALGAWSRAYADPALLEVVSPSAREAVSTIADACIYGNAYTTLAPVAAGIDLVAQPAWGSEPWRRIRRQAGPGASRPSVPVLLVQGGADKVVPPAETEQLARRLCATGQPVEVRVYPTAEHIEAGIVASPDVASWIGGRFAGAPAPSTCR